MNRTILVAALLVVSGCSAAARDAEEEFRFLQSKDAPASELCAAASRARDEWAKEQNSSKYDEWKFSAEVHCLNATTERMVRQ
jgi:hypothetical protein